MRPDSRNEYPSGNTASLWVRTYPVPDYPKLARDRRCEVCVVGAGIAGLSTAYMLAKGGRKVIVLDDGPIGGGESSRTTAHLTGAMDDRIYELERMHGDYRTRLVVESHLAAVNRIEEIVRLEGIDCDFERIDGFLFAGGDDRAAVLEREYDAAKRAGFADAELVDRAPIASWSSGRALRFPDQAQFHPLEYLAGLARAIEANGGEIFCGTHVTSVEGGSPCTVETDAGGSVTADAVCVCTNGSITDMTHTHAKQAPYRTYVIAAVVPRGSVSKGLFWDTASPYHYVRTQPLDERAAGALKGDTLYDALIVGGEDHKTAHENDAEERWRCLEQWMRHRWPQAREVIYRWSGQCLEPNDSLAFIGRNPDGAENVYMVSGDSGQGMTHGTIAGMLLTDLIAGRPNAWEALYDPKRVTLEPRPIEKFVKQNLDVAVRYLEERLTPSDVPTENDIARGEGRVMRKGAHKVAVYRDESGTLHYRSAVCTHLACIVAWNSAEKSWDCGCHGSRFDALGKVLNGPAVKNLAPYEEGRAAESRRIAEPGDEPEARS